jgi:hypothetical protein
MFTQTKRISASTHRVVEGNICARVVPCGLARSTAVYFLHCSSAAINGIILINSVYIPRGYFDALEVREHAGRHCLIEAVAFAGYHTWRGITRAGVYFCAVKQNVNPPRRHVRRPWGEKRKKEKRAEERKEERRAAI